MENSRLRCWLAGIPVLAAAALVAGPALAQVQMTEVSAAAGLAGVTYGSATDHSLGINWLDFDNDGWLDIFAVGGNPARGVRLYRNLGDGTFADARDLLPTLPLVETSGSVFADYDNDGDLDVYVYTDTTVWDPEPANNPDSGAPNLLLRNLWSDNGGAVIPGEKLFVETAAAAGVDDLADPPLGPDPGYRSKAAAWVDYDRDGCLDLYVGHWVMNEGGSPGNVDRLFRNQCDGTFADVTVAANVNPGTDPTTFRATLAVIGAHLDADLWPEIYVVNAGGGIELQPYINDFFYRNLGDGTFVEDSGASPGVCDDAQAGMGIDVADVDLDGDWDFYVSDLRSTTHDALPKGNVLYLGNGDGTFADNAAVAAGVQGDNSWGVNFFDVDQDGDEDLYVSTMAGTDPDLSELLYINDGVGEGGVTFTNVALTIGMATGNSRGSAVADYDRDGDLDLAVVNQGGGLQLFRNDTAGAGGWLQVRLQGVASNRDAIGAIVEARLGETVLRRQVKGGSSAHSQDALTVHFGLGAAASVDELRVRWPSGAEDVLTGLAVERRLRVVEGQLFSDDFENGDFGAWSEVAQ